MSDFMEFEIKIDTLPDNWSNVVEALRKEGIDIDPLLTPKDENDAFPIPWDASFEIEGEDVVLTGSAQPGGSPGSGECVTKYPRLCANDYFILSYQVYEFEDGPAAHLRFIQILKKYDITYSW